MPRKRVQKDVRAARGGVVGDEEEIIAGRRDRDVAARAGDVCELGAERRARRIAGEDAQQLAVGRRGPRRSAAERPLRE